MPIVTGAKPESSFADPIGVLTGCYRSVERLLPVLVEASATVRGGRFNNEQMGGGMAAQRGPSRIR